LLVQLFLPVAMVLLYQFMFSKMPSDQSSDMIMATMPSIILGFIGTTITYLIAEENEKHNLTSLQLAGMGSLEYLLANLTLPLVIELVYLIALPLYLGVSLSSLGLTYAVVNLLTA
ncbi:ABC transporter permease, partial [Streptococcus suis]